MSMHREPWTDKPILVTGGSGFVGRHLLARLQQAGYARIFAPRHAECDLTQEAAVRSFLQQTRPAAIVHLAAHVGGIGANRRTPGTFAYQNLIMGTHLIEQARQIGVEKFVLLGTICSYPKHTPVPFKEADLWNGYPEETNAPYGLAKKMLMVLLQAYRQQYGLCGITLLPTNLYGHGDHFDPQTSHVIPALIRKCHEAKKQGSDHIVVWGTGMPTREFLYVEEAVRAIHLAVERYDEPEPINLGSGREIAIADLARLIASMVGFQGEIRFDTAQPDGQPRRCLDVSRAEEIFGFRSAVDLEEGLQRTIAWYLEHQIW